MPELPAPELQAARGGPRSRAGTRAGAQRRADSCSSRRVRTSSRRRPPDTRSSDKNRMARAPERPPDPKNLLPFSRGNTPERARPRDAGAAGAGVGRPSLVVPDSSDGREDDRLRNQAPARAEPRIGRAAFPDPSRPGPSAGQSPPGANLRAAEGCTARSPDASETSSATPRAMSSTTSRWRRRVSARRSSSTRRAWSSAVDQALHRADQTQTGSFRRRDGAPGTRRHHVQRHKDGRISDLAVPGPCNVEAFKQRGLRRAGGIEPDAAAPAEYPADRAFFTVTFYYNEAPPGSDEEPIASGLTRGTGGGSREPLIPEFRPRRVSG